MDLAVRPQLPQIRNVGGVPVVNSRDIAVDAGKQHKHVLRDIETILSTGPDLGSLNWFRPAIYFDPKGEQRPCYDLTEEGWSMLALAWTGPRWIEFRARYIQAFQEMRSQIQANAPDASLVQLTLNLSHEFESLRSGQARIESSVDEIKASLTKGHHDIRLIRDRVIQQTTAKAFKEVDIRHYVSVLATYHSGLCPCCKAARIVECGVRIADASHVDHFFSYERHDREDGWLVCVDCNHRLKDGNFRREKEIRFKAFQDDCRQLSAPDDIPEAPQWHDPKEQLALFEGLPQLAARKVDKDGRRFKQRKRLH